MSTPRFSRIEWLVIVCIFFVLGALVQPVIKSHLEGQRVRTLLVEESKVQQKVQTLPLTPSMWVQEEEPPVVLEIVVEDQDGNQWRVILVIENERRPVERFNQREWPSEGYL